MQSESIKSEATGDWLPEKAFFYIIHDGTFRVSSLSFKKTSQAKKIIEEPKEEIFSR